MKRVAVVILNWNGENFLKKFLPSVLSSCCEKEEGLEAEVIVADNGSSDNSHKAFSAVCGGSSSCRWIQLDKNYGFTGGYNRAIQILNTQQSGALGYDYFILLNSDIYTPAGWLSPLISFMEAHPQAAVCQPKILAYKYSKFDTEDSGGSSSDSFEYAGACGGFIDKFGFPFCRGRILSSIEKDSGQYDTPLRTFWATGACMVVRSGVWKELGGLDEGFFAHMEEIDFCWRAALLGHEIWCVPQSAVYHVGGGTLPNNSPRKLFFNYRNNLLMLRKNLPAHLVSKKIFLRKIIDGLSAVAYCLQLKFSFALSVFKAHRDYNKKKRSLTPSPRVESAEKHLLYGVYPHSIIFRFFTGRRTYNKL